MKSNLQLLTTETHLMKGRNEIARTEVFNGIEGFRGSNTIYDGRRMVHKKKTLNLSLKIIAIIYTVNIGVVT